MVVDCAALQESLLQSELFGHERGAFTGADKAKPGLFEVANGGTIFLDEIGEISPSTQTKLLRVLDSRYSATSGAPAKFAWTCASSRPPIATCRQMVRQGQFREDLYYRMSTIAMEIPPLRRRGSDIELLARHFIGVLNERFGASKFLSPAAVETLRRHHWPGNVRELKHAVEAATVVCEASEILPEHLPTAVRSAPRAENGVLPTLDELERAHIRRALEASKGHRGSAARILGISERNLYRKLKEHRLLS